MLDSCENSIRPSTRPSNTALASLCLGASSSSMTAQVVMSHLPYLFPTITPSLSTSRAHQANSLPSLVHSLYSTPAQVKGNTHALRSVLQKNEEGSSSSKMTGVTPSSLKQKSLQTPNTCLSSTWE